MGEGLPQMPRVVQSHSASPKPKKVWSTSFEFGKLGIGHDRI